MTLYFFTKHKGKLEWRWEIALDFKNPRGDRACKFWEKKARDKKGEFVGQGLILMEILQRDSQATFHIW